MLRPRIIPTLLLDGSRFVKTKRYRNPKYVGDPLNIVKIFNQKEVDEILILNISSANSKPSHDYEFISTVASESSAPVTYGGNISTIDEVERIFAAGIEKICLKNIAYADPLVISKIANKYGSQAIMISIDIQTNLFGQYKLHSNRKFKNLDLIAFVDQLVACGAGEILLNAVHKEGTLSGPDFNLIKSFSEVSIPLIYNGGIGSLNDIKNCLLSGAHSVGIGSWFIYHGSLEGVLISYPTFQERLELNLL